jgi:hypothetical protein
MEMQDKEFDKLFSTKLDAFEAEPSRAVWQGINEGLGGNKRKKLAPFLSIAASVLILITAGILFLTQKGRVVKPHAVNDKVAVAVNHPAKITPATAAIKPQAIATPKTTLAATNTVTNTPRMVKNRAIITPHRQVMPVQQQTPVKVQQQPALASATIPKKEVIQSVAVDTTTMLAAVPVVHPQAEKPVVIASTVPPEEKLADTPPVKKHRLRSLGDVLNVMIAAVDKRKDKVIEFSDTDEDESSITGINLGIIKIKKQN